MIIQLLVILLLIMVIKHTIPHQLLIWGVVTLVRVWPLGGGGD